MRPSIPLWLLGALGLLSLSVGHDAGAADPSQWTCESCPFETGTSVTLDGGAGTVSSDSPKFGDFTGLDRRGVFAVLGGTVRYRRQDGLFGNVAASDLGLDARALAAELGQEGRYGVRLGYSELPHLLGHTTLPALDLGITRKRLDFGASLTGPPDWTWRLDARRDVRDGTQRSAGSFFSTTSQLAMPVDQVTDQVEASASYTGRRLQASLAYRVSSFRNADDALTWQNPFPAVVPGADRGQLALAPDNQFHQVAATAGYQITPAVRASADIALGRMTQDAPYLPATLNPGLAVPPLPAASLHGRADTLDASVRLTAAPIERLRLAASLTRNERDNRTPSAAYPTVSTDMFLGAAPRINLPYSFTRDRAKLAADWRGPAGWRLAAGVEQDTVHRTLQETGTTREASVWARASAQPRPDLAVSLKLAHAERDNSGYDVVAAVQPPDNPLLRKYNQADRRRDTAGLRADLTLGETVSLGLGVDLANDDYAHSPLGLTNARSGSAEADVSWAISDTTRLHAFAQEERIRSLQAGSQQFAQPDWVGRSKDTLDVVGIGVTHSALKGKLELGADVALMRSRSDTTIEIGGSGSPFPAARTSRDSLKLFANWRMTDKLSLLGSWWYERYDEQDWHLDGVLPTSVPNLLAFGEQPPRYHVNVVRVVLRYRWR